LIFKREDGRRAGNACRTAGSALDIPLPWRSPGRDNLECGSPWRRVLEREGRALASAVQHTRPSMRKIVTDGYPGGPGRRPVARAWLEASGFSGRGQRWPVAM